MGYGKIVVASNQTFSAIEFIIDGKNGFLFKSEDVQDLSLKIENAIRCNLDSYSVAAKKAIEVWPVQRGVDLIKEFAFSLSKRVN